MSLLHNTNTPTRNVRSSIARLLSLITLFGMGLVPFAFATTLEQGIETPKIVALGFTVSILLILWVVQAILSKSLVVRRFSLDLLIGAVLLSTVLSSVFSLLPAVSFLGKTHVFILHSTVICAFALWTWLLVQIVRSKQTWHALLQVLLLVGCVQAVIFFWNTVVNVSLFAQLQTWSLMSQSNVLVSTCMASFATLALGIVLSKRSPLLSQVLGYITLLLALAVLIRIGFSTGFVVLAIGTACLTVVGIVFLSSVRRSHLMLVFALFIGSLLAALVGVPRSLHAMLPVEVSLGTGASYQIAQQVILDNPKQFLIGTGPGTFLQTFLTHRNPNLNMHPIAAGIRFHTPHQTASAVLVEFGVIGTLLQLLLLVGIIGLMLGLWHATRPTFNTSEKTSAPGMPVLVWGVASTLVTLSASLFLVYAGFMLLLLWWTFLALFVVGTSFVAPRTIREWRLSLEVSPQYSVMLSFSMILLATAMIVFGAFGVRILLADQAYVRALTATSVPTAEANLVQALEYRSGYVPYLLTSAEFALQKARLTAANTPEETETITSQLAAAVNTAKQATTLAPADITAWETLANMYLQTQQLVPEAGSWAVDALDKAIALDPTNPTLYVQRGSALAYAEDLLGAKENYARAIVLKPDYVEAYTSLSLIFEAEEAYDEAIAAYEPIIRYIETNPTALFTLGRLFYNRQAEGDLGRAETVLMQALSVQPQFANAEYTLGLVYEAQGKLAAARDLYQSVLKNNPDNEMVRSRLNAL